MDISAYEALDRDQLTLREELLNLGIEHFRARLDKIHPENRKWLEREITSLEKERNEVHALRHRKFRDDLRAARTALAEGPDAVAEFLQSR